jgi:RNA:NAD 2'-phosphotransferase (TPT1/KptA family)
MLSDKDSNAELAYRSRWGVDLSTALRHRALREALAETGGFASIRRLAEVLRKRGMHVGRGQIRKDLDFMKRAPQILRRGG